MTPEPMTRIDELQADRALWGLDPAEELELAKLAQSSSEAPEADWERAAAATMMALDRPLPSGPSPELMERLRASAPVRLPSQGQQAPAPRPLSMTGPVRAPKPEAPPRAAGRSWVSYFVTAAAVTLAAILWVDRPKPPAPVESVYDSLLQSTEASRWDWTKGTSPLSGNPGGELVWSDSSQTGVMKFTGLPPTTDDKVYQLWIVDADRTGKPVDGGVFQIREGQKQHLVSIDAKLKVNRASKFIITLEPKGGVVVSDLSHIIALAQPK